MSYGFNDPGLIMLISAFNLDIRQFKKVSSEALLDEKIIDIENKTLAFKNYKRYDIAFIQPIFDSLKEYEEQIEFSSFLHF